MPRSRSVVGLAVATLAILGVAPVARADDGTSPPLPSASASAPARIDPHAPGLRLPEGDTLAAPKVLDIVAVTDESATSASVPDQRQEVSNSTVTYALQAEVLFTKDSAVLSPTAASRIRAIAADINGQGVTSPIWVFGFTDDLGSSEHGQVLSKARANAVYKVLAEQLGALGGPAHTFQVRGYGEEYPIADNSSDAGRRQNRRVEITFTPPAT